MLYLRVDNSLTLRPRDLQYSESQCSQAVTPERSKGFTKGTKGFYGYHWPRCDKLVRLLQLFLCYYFALELSQYHGSYWPIFTSN